MGKHLESRSGGVLKSVCRKYVLRHFDFGAVSTQASYNSITRIRRLQSFVPYREGAFSKILKRSA